MKAILKQSLHMFKLFAAFTNSVLLLPSRVCLSMEERRGFLLLPLSILLTANTWTSFMWLGCNHQIDPKDWYTLLQWGSTFLCPPPPTSWYPPCLFDLSFSIAHTHTGMKNWVCSLNREILRQEKMTECCIACKYNRSITNCDNINLPPEFPHFVWLW